MKRAFFAPTTNSRLFLTTLCVALFATACSEEAQQNTNLEQYELISLDGVVLPYPPASATLFREILGLTPSPASATQVLTFRGDNSEIKVSKKLDVTKVQDGYMINFSCELDQVACPNNSGKVAGVVKADTLKFASAPNSVARVYVRRR